MKKLFILLLGSLLSGTSFPTVWGTCQFDFVSDDLNTIQSVRDIIIKETKRAVVEFGDIPLRSFSVIVAKNKKEFNLLTKGYAPEWSVAVTIRKLNRIIMLSPAASNITFSRFHEVLVHELNHIYMFRIKNFGTSPSWFIEGLAMRASGELSLTQKIKISQAKWRKQLLALARLQNMHTRNSWEIGLAYGQSAAAIYAMEYFYDDKIVRLILDMMRSGMDFEQAFFEATGDDQLDFQIKYDRYIDENYSWMFLLKTSNLAFGILPFILIFGFYLRYRRNKKVLKRWELEEELTETDAV